MRRIINDVMYDTELSDLIYEDVHTHQRWYKTKNDRFFIAYISGDICVVDEETVKQLLGSKDINMYIELFGEPEEG